MKKWRPKVKTHIDWEGVLNAAGGKVGSAVGGASVPKPSSDDGETDGATGDSEQSTREPEFLTIGVIGEPIFTVRSEIVDSNYS